MVREAVKDQEMVLTMVRNKTWGRNLNKPNSWLNLKHKPVMHLDRRVIADQSIYVLSVLYLIWVVSVQKMTCWLEPVEKD